MAEIKPEPTESPTMSSTPPKNIPSPASPTSFGDLLSSKSQPPSIPSNPPIPSTPSPSPQSPQSPLSPESSPSSPISFGDLIKDIKPEESVVQPPPIPPETPPVPPNPPPIANNPQPMPSPSPISPLSPVSPISPIPPTVNIDEKLKEALALRRQKANQKRHQKKEEMLNKLVSLVQSRGKITNREAQKILHLPQSTLTDYFQELVSQGTLEKEGKGKATYYHL